MEPNILAQFLRTLAAALQAIAESFAQVAEGFTKSSSAIVRALGETLYVVGRGLNLSIVGSLPRLVLVSASAPPRRTRSLSDAIDALQAASSFVQELENDLQARTAQLRELQTRYDHLEQLTAIEQDKARALLGEVADTVGRGRKREYAVAFLINVVVAGLFFLLGLSISK